MSNYNPILHRDLTDPNSPYCLNAPSSIEQINNYLYGNGRNNYYRTNYLGPINNRFITPLHKDQVEIQGMIRERSKREGVFFAMVGGLALLGSLMLFKKPTPATHKVSFWSKLFGK